MKQIEAPKEQMTLFYSKRTKEIKAYTGGEIDFGYFGDDQEDMEIIYDRLVMELDEFVLDNTEKFKVVDSELKLKEAEIPERFL